MEGPDAAPKTTAQQQKQQNGAGDGAARQLSRDPPAAPPKRRLKRSTRMALSVVAVVALLAAAGFGGAYFLHSRTLVSTDNAQVDGDQIQINAPATGTLLNWQITKGTQLHTNQIVGRIGILTGFGQPQRTIRAPGNGTVAVNNGVEGEWVQAGTQLAVAYDFSKIYITARVDETDIDAVRVGALVDISVDAFSTTPVTGIVQEIQGAAANRFALFPEQNSTGNFQKVTQVIPVKIMLINTNGVALAPGMNVTVHIHKQGT